MDSVVHTLATLGVLQGLVLSIFFLSKWRANRRANAFIGLFMAGLCLRIGKSLFNIKFNLEPWQLNMGIAGLLLCGPSVWFFSKSLFISTLPNLRWILIHYSPFFLMIAFSWLVPNDGSHWANMVYALILLHFIVYVIAAFNVFRCWGDSAHENTVVWFKHLATLSLVIWSLYFLVFVRLLPYYIAGALAFSGAAYLMSWLILNRTINHQSNVSFLSGDDKKQINQALLVWLVDNKNFRKANLKIGEVARAINCNERQLSQVINSLYNTNFSDFLNRQRVEAAKVILQNNQSKKMFAVADESGFGSLSNFNRVFKEIEGITPAAYRDQCKHL